MIAALVAGVVLRNSEFLLYFAVLSVLIAAVTLVHLWTYLHITTRWALSLWGLAHMAGGLVPLPQSWQFDGEMPVLYNLWLIPGLLKYDQLVHAAGSAVVTWSCWQALRGAFVRRGVEFDASFGLLSLCMAGGMGFGAANETLEFLATRVLSKTNVGGYMNTGWDLVANCVGSMFAACVLYFAERAHCRGTGSERSTSTCSCRASP